MRICLTFFYYKFMKRCVLGWQFCASQLQKYLICQRYHCTLRFLRKELTGEDEHVVLITPWLYRFVTLFNRLAMCGFKIFLTQNHSMMFHNVL